MGGGLKEGSAKDKHGVIDIKLGKTQSLKPFNLLSSTKGLTGVTSASAPKRVKRDRRRGGRNTRVGQGIPSLTFFDSLVSLLTHPPLLLLSSIGRCVNEPNTAWCLSPGQTEGA